jgi:hypothetical protein
MEENVMEFGSAFSFAFQDPDWMKKIGIAAVIFLIPLVGPFILAGWGLEITRRVINNDPVPLPDWSDFSGFLLKGFHAAVVGLAYALPGLLILICGEGIIGLTTSMSHNSGNSSTVGGIASIVALCMTCLVTILLLGAGFLIPAATGNLAASGDLGAAFRFNEVIQLVRAAPGPYIMIVLGLGLVNSILSSLGILACGIGILFTTAYTTTLASHLIGQAYNAAKAALAVSSAV